MTRIYIAGPITGYADLNKPAFGSAQEAHEALGFTVFNPHSITAPPSPENLTPEQVWQYYMKICIQHLVQCDEIYMLRDWQNSRGAVKEHRIAEWVGMPIHYQEIV